MALSHAERIELGLDDPGQVTVVSGTLVDEYQPLPPSGHALPPATTPNLRLVLKSGEKATAPKIRGMVNELLAGNMQNADRALQQLFQLNPKEGLKLYVELMAFSMPQLKAVAMQIDDRSENPRALGFAELQRLLAADSPPAAPQPEL